MFIERISYIVSEDFFEQFTALAFIDFKKNLFLCPACRVCHEEADSYEKFKASLRRRLAAKTRLASQVLKKIKLALRDPG